MKKGHKIIKETVPQNMNKAMKFSLKVFNTGKALFVSTINFSMKLWKRVFVFKIMQIKSYITFFR